MQVFNRSRALFRVNYKRDDVEVRFLIKVTRTPHSGLGHTLTMPGYSSALNYFT